MNHFAAPRIIKLWWFNNLCIFDMHCLPVIVCENGVQRNTVWNTNVNDSKMDTILERGKIHWNLHRKSNYIKIGSVPLQAIMWWLWLTLILSLNAVTVTVWECGMGYYGNIGNRYYVISRSVYMKSIAIFHGNLYGICLWFSIDSLLIFCCVSPIPLCTD